MKKYFLLLFTVYVSVAFSQKHECVVVYSFYEDGQTAEVAYVIKTDGSFTNGISVPVFKENKEDVLKTLKAQNYKIQPHPYNELYDEIIIFDTSFSFVNYTTFSSTNIKINKDTTTFKLTNKYNTDHKNNGSASTHNFTNYTQVMEFPDKFEIVKFTVKNKDVTIINNGNFVGFTGENINNVIYEVEYKIRKTPNIKSFDKIKNKQITTLKIKRVPLTMEIWDDVLEDGDIVNLYINGKIAIEKFEALNKKKLIPLPINLSKGNKIEIVIESVSEGKIKPNTIMIRFYDNEKNIDKTIDVAINKKSIASIIFEIED